MVNVLQTIAVLAFAVASVARAEASSPTSVSAAPVCTVRVSKVDLDAGVDVVPDASCKLGDEGCVQDGCRACKHWDSEWSQAFPDCQAFMAPTAPTAAKATTAAALSFAAASTQDNTNAGLAAIGDDGARVWQLGIGGGLFAAAAVAAMAFAAKRAKDAQPAPETVSPSGSLVYRRASVFHI